MVGSRKFFTYTTDAGDSFALSADESNVELAGGGIDLTGGASLLYELPRNVKPRYARYRSADGLVIRKAYLCTVGAVPTTPITDPSSGLSLDLSAIVAEQVTFPTGVDTGLIDGDAS